MRQWIGYSIDRQSRWVARWLHSRSAFVWLVYGTVLWIPLVAIGVDPHGFLYLYIATSLSLITQVPLAMLAYWAAQEGSKNEEMNFQMLSNQADMMRLVLQQAGDIEEDLERLLGGDDEETGSVLPLVDEELEVDIHSQEEEGETQ